MPKKELDKVRKKRRGVCAIACDPISWHEKAPAEVRHQAESSLAALEDQIEVMAGLEQELRQEVGKFTGDTQKLDTQALEMESIQTEIKSAEEMAKLIGGELEVLKIELQAPDRVRLIKEAKAPLAVDGSQGRQNHWNGGGGSIWRRHSSDFVLGISGPTDQFARRSGPWSRDQSRRHGARETR